VADPFEHFEEQERSWSALKALGPKLAQQAAAQLAAEPAVPLAGLIVERGAAEMGRTLPQPPPEWQTMGLDFVGIVKRSVVESILRGNGGEDVLAWMLDHESDDRLPILVCSRHGFRMKEQTLPS
jgi:hypothetical protein